MRCIYVKKDANKASKTECKTAPKTTKFFVILVKVEAIKMAQIDLKSAYDLATQKDLFRLICSENIDDAEEYSDAQVAAAKRQFGCWKTITELAQDLLKMYQNRWQSKVNRIDDPLSYYVVIDYSSMLQDDIFTGYFNLIKCENGDFTLLMTPEGAKNSLLTHNC